MIEALNPKDRFMEIAKKTQMAFHARANDHLPVPDGFTFIKNLPQAEIIELAKDIAEIREDIMVKINTLLLPNPSVMYKTACRKLEERLAIYRLIASINTDGSN